MSRANPSSFKLLFTELQTMKLLAFGAFGVLLLSVMATLAGPFLVQRFVDLATSGADSSDLIQVSLLYLLLSVTGGAARIAKTPG